MGLKYTELDEIKNEYISLNGITDSFSKLIENDNQLLISLKSKPGLWECMWYNDNQVNGYSKGAAVWLNTEVDSEIVSQKYDTIKQYILDSKYRSIYLSISGDATQVNSLFTDVCNGDNGYERLFYLGDIHEPVQVRISKIDNNKSLPSDDRYWGDVLRLSNDQFYLTEMNDMLSSLNASNLSNHMQFYHLSGYTWKDIASTYLMNDFSNIEETQQLITHSIKSRGDGMYGYDKVLKFVKTTKENEKRWFRIWQSGMLEHGGVISSLDGNSTSVDLNWTYTENDQTLTAPSYDYKVVHDGFYSADEISVNNQKYDIDARNIGSQLTYSIQVSPIDEGIMDKRSTEVFNITNDGFSIVRNQGNKMYSYHTTGFITSSQLRRIKLWA